MTSATPTSRSAAARCADPLRAARPGHRPRARPGHVYAGGNDLIRPRCDVDALGEVYDEAIGSWPPPGHGGTVHRLRPGWRRTLRPAAWPVRGCTTSSPGDRRPARAVVLDSWRMRPSTPALMWSRTGCTSARSAIARSRSRCSARLGVPHDLDLSDRTGSLGRHHFAAARGPTSTGPSALPPWIKRRLTGGPPATASPPSGRPWSPSEHPRTSGSILHAGSAGMRM
jgi:hypothetical protein